MFGEALGSLGLGGTAGGGFAAAGMMGLSAASTAYNIYQQERQYKYEKNLQQDIFAREDNSIQRRVADLRAAGLSPVLAAGQGAGTGSVVSTTAPQAEDLGSKYMAMIKMANDISMSKTQKDLMMYQMDLAANQTEAAKAQALKTYVEAGQADDNRKIYKKWGMPSTVTGDLQKLGFIKGAVDDAKKGMMDDKPSFIPSKQAPGESNRAYAQRKLIEERERKEREALNKKYK